MPAHPIDFLIQANTFSTPELLAVFDEKTRFRRWLQFEAALAATQGELGIIPREAALEIEKKSSLEQLDLAAVAESYKKSRNSVLPVIKELRAACQGTAGEYVHYGATTQDVLDTGQALELKDATQIIYRDLRQLEQNLLIMAEQHKSTPMIGRTHGQQALPITFGFKAAIWISEIRRHIERLKTIFPRIIIGQLSGAVGTMAALGPQAQETARKTMTRLGLNYSAIAWHTARDNMAETAGLFAMIATSLEKFANEIFELGKTEIGELREPAPQSAMSSSTMPHKRNPVICQRISVLARHVRALNGVVLEAMVHEHERDARALWAESLALPQISVYTGTAVHYINQVVTGLEINPERMLQNLYLHKEMAVSEWLMFKLAQHIGRTKAQSLVHKLSNQTYVSGQSLKELLLEDQETASLLSAKDMDFLDHPEKYTGQAINLTDQMIAATRQKRNNDPELLK
ncbi:MAG: adenylosuccinate lyase [Proteobacteria bacterium]|nr:adenylosuccinate lyase [Pseudomonadota bacterium]MBU1714048.1 adenylosuccinate lyase [Pseudomonadota bacterium]